MKRISLLLKPLVLAVVIFCAALAHSGARADMLVIVNADNPLNQLTLKEVKQLFLGRMRRFPSVDNNVDVLDREESSLAHRHFYQYVVEVDSNRLKRYRARYLFSGQGRLPETVIGQEKVIEKVQRDRSAVGYVDLPPESDLPDGVKVVYRQALPAIATVQTDFASADAKAVKEASSSTDAQADKPE